MPFSVVYLMDGTLHRLAANKTAAPPQRIQKISYFISHKINVSMGISKLQLVSNTE